jgi:hypothetical protein
MHHDSRDSVRLDGALAVDLVELDGRGGPDQQTVVCPYTRAGQSGILAFVGRLGLPSAAADVSDSFGIT